MIPIPGLRRVVVFWVHAWWVTTIVLAVFWISNPGQWALAAAPQSTSPCGAPIDRSEAKRARRLATFQQKPEPTRSGAPPIRHMAPLWGRK